MPISSLPFLSVIIPAYNAEDTIEESIGSILSQTYPKDKYEVVVADNNSKDQTVEKVKKFSVRVVSETQIQGPGAARNKGASIAKGEWLVFFDADQMAHSDYLIQLLDGFEDQTIGAFASRNIGVNTKGNLAGDYWVAEWSGENMVCPKNSLMHFSGGNFAIRAEAFRKLGGFDLSFTTYEDIELAWRLQKDLGLKIKYNRNAVSDHKERVSARSLLRREFKIGTGGYQLFLKHPDGCHPNSYYLRRTLVRTFTGILAIIKKLIYLLLGKEKIRNIQMVMLGIAMNWAECLGRYNGQMKINVKSRKYL